MDGFDLYSPITEHDLRWTCCELLESSLLQQKEPNLFSRNSGVLDILQCGSPLLAARSAIQHLLIMANHRKNWHFLGAQLAHIRFHAAKETDPIKNASYANLVVY